MTDGTDTTASKEGGLDVVSPDIAQYKRMLASQGSASWNRGTVILGGPGRAGKTALMHSLVGDRYPPGGYSSTVGADICTRTVKQLQGSRGRDSAGDSDSDEAGAGGSAGADVRVREWAETDDSGATLEATMALCIRRRFATPVANPHHPPSRAIAIAI